MRYLLYLAFLTTVPLYAASRNEFYSPAKMHRQSVDWYPSTDAQSTSTVFFIHGGAWIGGDAAIYKFVADAFLPQKYSVALVNYRYASPELHFPVAVDDTAEALKFVTERHPKNTRQIFVIGHSAGAHTAAVLGLDPSYASAVDHVRAFVGLEGIYDVPKLAARWPNYRNWFLDVAFGADEKRWPSASPQFMSAKSPARWLVVHSPQDELVDLGQSERFHRHLQEIGVAKAELFTALTDDHSGVVTRLGDPKSPLFKKVAEFIRQ